MKINPEAFAKVHYTQFFTYLSHVPRAQQVEHILNTGVRGLVTAHICGKALGAEGEAKIVELFAQVAPHIDQLMHDARVAAKRKAEEGEKKE